MDKLFGNKRNRLTLIDLENILGVGRVKINNTIKKYESSPDSCVKCYTMFLPFLLIKIDVFS